MKILTLIENTPGQCTTGYAEHGLSIYVKTKEHQILIDTGASFHTWENAKQLGIDISQVDLVFLSHGHYDHCGGVLSFVKQNQKATLYLHANGILDYYSIKDETMKYIGIDKEICQLPNLKLIDSNIKIDNSISLFCDVTKRKLWPKSNLRLKKLVKNEYIQDSFDHEQYIVIQEEGKYYLFSGCAHNGIINILDRFKEIYGRNPDVVVSGFHMARKTQLSKEDISMIQEIGWELKKTNTIFYTGHCTGLEAFGILKEILQEQLHYMHSQEEIIGENDNEK